MTTTEKLMAKIKNNKLVAGVIVFATCLLAVMAFFDKIISFHDTHLADDIELVSMALAPKSAQIFSDAENLTCRFDQKTIREFQPKGERAPSGEIGLVFTFSNTSASPILFKAAVLDVSFIKSLAGGSPGVIESNHTYRLKIGFATGKQRFPLTPNYAIPAKEAGAFTLAMTPRDPGTGRCWIARIHFETTAGDVSSPPFQMILSKQ